MAGAQLTLRWGRRGSRGQDLTKRFDTPEAAQREADRLLRQKLAKGYREV